MARLFDSVRAGSARAGSARADPSRADRARASATGRSGRLDDRSRSSSRRDPRPRPGSGSRPRARSFGREHRWRLRLWRIRFLVAAVALGLATAQVVAALSPPPPWTVPVVVANHDLTPGDRLSAGDVAVVDLPGALVPRGTHRRPEDVVGHALVIEVPAGLPLVDDLLAGAGLAHAGPVGTVVAPVRLADPAVAALLRPGDRIDLLASTSSADGEPSTRTLATRALVLADPSPVAAAGEGAGVGALLTGGQGDATGQLTVVAVSPAEAAALAGSTGWAALSAVLVK